MKKEKKIIYINGRFLTQKITGVQRYAIEVVKQLDKLKCNYEFILLIPKKEVIQEIELNNIKVLKIGSLTGHIWEQISLPLYIHTHKREGLLNLCNIAPMLYPGYVTIHDLAFKTHSEHLEKKFSLWYRFVTRVNIRRYKHIFTVSNFSKNEIIENYNISPNRITITYDSAEHIKNVNPDYGILTKLRLEDKDFYFSLGSKSPHKNHKYIMELAKNNSEKIFVVSGGNNNKIFNNDEDIKYDNMIFTGYLEDKELVALYKKCKAFIFPSLYEGFGIPPLEAIQCGCRSIILSNIEVLKEIYGDVGNYIDPNNMKHFNISIKEIKELQRKEILEKYSWKNTTINIINAIDKEMEK